jgi:hypothetical protein
VLYCRAKAIGPGHRGDTATHDLNTIPSGADAGVLLQASSSSLPAETTTTVPLPNAAATALLSDAEKGPPRDMEITCRWRERKARGRESLSHTVREGGNGPGAPLRPKKKLWPHCTMVQVQVP